MKYLLALTFLAAFFIGTASAESIYVKYRGEIDISKTPLKNLEIKPSSLVKRMLYDKGNKYLVVKLSGTFYHYCGIPESKVNEWVAAKSLGRYYSSNIRGNFDCRVFPWPRY